MKLHFFIKKTRSVYLTFKILFNLHTLKEGCFLHRRDTCRQAEEIRFR